jgi:hypothetical protein
MLRKMSMRQFMLWREFDEVEPIGGLRGDWQAASICSALFNTMAMFSRSKQRMTVEQFLLKYGQPRRTTRGKDGGSKTPSAAPHWQHLKFIAQMQVALSKAEEGKKKKTRG